MKRKLCFTAAAFVFVLGIFLTLTRKDPIVKNIGYVYLICGENETALKGYKVSSLSNNRKTEYEQIDLKEIADNLYEISVTDNDKPDIKLTFRKNFTAVKYDIYDDSFNIISESQENIYFSGSEKGKYYISVGVNWGSKKENILVRYYFAVNIG